MKEKEDKLKAKQEATARKKLAKEQARKEKIAQRQIKTAKENEHDRPINDEHALNKNAEKVQAGIKKQQTQSDRHHQDVVSQQQKQINKLLALERKTEEDGLEKADACIV